MPRKNLPAAAVALVAVGTCALAWRAGWIPRMAWQRAPPNLLLVSIDTLRADRLGCYGYAAAQTPVLDALAGRGVRFAEATTVAPLTLPAHASLLTGTFPAYHGVRDNGGFYLGDDQQTLAETLKARGYRTGGFAAAFVLDRRWGVGQGFDTYFDDFDLSRYDMSVGLDAAQRPGREVVDHALAWLGTGGGPFFAWVHLYEPHSPYTPPEPYRSRFPSTMEGAYDGEVATADTEVGRLLAYLDAHGALANTIVIVVGDHGESLGEHREQQHGFFVYDASAQIPLIVAGPGLQSRVVRSQVRIVDVMPTALELLGVQAPATVQGASLVPLARGERRTLPALVETWYPRYHYGWSELRALRDGRYKFIAAPRPELYDTDADPGENHDLSSANPRLAEAMADALRRLEAHVAGAAAPQAPRTVDAAVEERLRALGYVGSSVSRTVLETRPRGDPKDKIELYNLLKLAGQDSVSGRIDDGIAKVRRVLAADPEVIEAYTMLGNMHAKAGRREEAIDAYRRALAVDAEHEGATWSLALAYKNAGRLAEAEGGFERVLQLDARSAKAMWQLADIWMRRGEFARAQRMLQQALAHDVDRAPFLVKLGESHIEQRQYDQARDALLEAVRVKPTQPMAHYDLGLVHEARGEWDEAASAYRREIEISPKLYQPQFNLAKLLARGGRHAEAVVHFRQAVALDPSFAEGRLYLAKSLLDTGDLSGAEAEARRGLAAGPEASAVALGHYVLADVYSRLGRPRDAAREAATGQRLEERARTSGGSPRSRTTGDRPGKTEALP